MTERPIRLAIPSKGRLSEITLEFLSNCGLRAYRPNTRQYIATIPSYPGVEIIFQRPGDIVTGVRQASLDFGITGFDILSEKNFGHEDKVLIIHDALGFGKCTLNIAIPNQLAQITNIPSLTALAKELESTDKILRVATKFPKLTAQFLETNSITPFRLIDAEGTLEIAPTIGYADIIVDLVSSGMTLKDNHLAPLAGGQILASQAILIANRAHLENPQVLAFARRLLEYIEAFQRGKRSYMVIANMRGETAELVAQKMFDHPELGGLRGPTIAPIYTRDSANWFSISIAVQQGELDQTISALRTIGGSGVIVTPAIYIFEEEPKRYREMIDQLKSNR